MKPTEERIKLLADRARQATLPKDAHATEAFVLLVLSQSMPSHRRGDVHACPPASDPRNSASDPTLLWMRYSLAALPVAASVTIACLLWFGSDLPHEVDDLVSTFIQSPLLP